VGLDRGNVHKPFLEGSNPMLLFPIAQKGDKILLPPSAFDTLARLQVDYPMLFRLSSPTRGTMTHCGVLEFTAEEGSCYIPFWMMQNLLIEEGTVITVTNVSLPKATFVKLQPQHVDFLEISNPRAVLEHALRNFSCVTKGDVIQVPYNSKNYHFELKEVQPQDAACIIETDCNVDFDAPVGYKEPETQSVGSSTASALSNLPKQSAYAEPRSSCPSPTASSTSGITNEDNGEEAETSGIRIVDGKIIRPNSSAPTMTKSAMMAARTGSTGVQPNAAIPENAPEVDYWAVQAGDGARLDGKKPTTLRDKDGTELDIRKLRAEAASKRAAAQQQEQQQTTEASTSKRTSRTGHKFSRLKTTGKAFQGSANSFS
jgi:ubiquitin fusion degradation protein 1